MKFNFKQLEEMGAVGVTSDGEVILKIEYWNWLVDTLHEKLTKEERDRDIYSEAYEQGVFDSRMYGYYEKPKLEETIRKYEQANKTIEELYKTRKEAISTVVSEGYEFGYIDGLDMAMQILDEALKEEA